MPEYKVKIASVSPSFLNVFVDASNEEEAGEKAIAAAKEAPDHDWEKTGIDTDDLEAIAIEEVSNGSS